MTKEQPERYVCIGCGNEIEADPNARIVATGEFPEPPIGVGENPLGVNKSVITPLTEPLYEIRDCDGCGENKWKAKQEK